MAPPSPLLRLPDETILRIAELSGIEENEYGNPIYLVYPLTLVNQRLNRIAEPILYKDHAACIENGLVRNLLHDSDGHGIPRDRRNLHSPMSALAWAIESNQLVTIDKVLQDTPQVAGVEHVAFAIEHNHPDIARALLSKDVVLKKLEDENDKISSRMQDWGRELIYVPPTHPMWEAVIHGDLDLVKQVLQGLPSEFFHDHVPYGGKYKGTLLHFACERGYMDIVRYLLDCGADPAKQQDGFLDVDICSPTPLSLAIKNKDGDLVQHLMDTYPDLVHSPYNFCTALESGDESLADKFFQAGVSVNAVGPANMMVSLLSAIAGGNAALVKRVLDLGAETGPITSTVVDSRQWPIEWLGFYGAHEDSVAIAKLLLERGVVSRPMSEFGPNDLTMDLGLLNRTVINQELAFDLSLFNLAVKSNNIELVDFLLQHLPVDPSMSSLGLARSPDMIRSLMLFGADLDVPDRDGCPPLVRCINEARPTYFRKCVDREIRVCRHSEEDIPGAVRFLASHVSDINAVNSHGSTALACCANSHEPLAAELAEILLAHSASPNLSDHHSLTPLHKAARAGNTKLVEILLRAGSDINALDYDLCTPLHYALDGKYGSDDRRTVDTHLIKLLLDRGADPDMSSRWGMPALHFPRCNDVSLLALLDLGVHPARRACTGVLGDADLLIELLRDVRKHRRVLEKIVRIAPDIVKFSHRIGTFPVMAAMDLTRMGPRYDWKTAVKFLVHHGADINMTTLAGSTVLDKYHSAIHEAGLRELGALRGHELNGGTEA